MLHMEEIRCSAVDLYLRVFAKLLSALLEEVCAKCGFLIQVRIAIISSSGLPTFLWQIAPRSNWHAKR
ncbi:MAG: hypothetical protein K0S45_4610 [Nitrospira sp.]|nr:hypothetical protein [Nitrospira sp.]